MARDPEQELNAARSSYEQSDLDGSLRHLDRARRAFAKVGDTEGLRRVLQFAERAEIRDERGAAVRDNLVYATKQNIRGTTRRDALRAKRAWNDPYPALEGPQEHTRIPVTRGLKFWIGAGVAIVLVGIAAYIAAVVAIAFWSTDSNKDELALRIHNDSPSTVVVKWCDSDTDCGLTEHWKEEIAPKLSAEQTLPGHDLVDELVVFHGNDKIGCLPVRVHDAWQQLSDKYTEVHVSVSQMTPCPGTTVLPT